MTKINEVYAQIDDLNKNIEEEPLNFKKRKIRLENEIKRIEESIKHAGLKSDFSSVLQFKSQKAILLQKRVDNQIPEFESQIERCKKEITNIIVEYYKEGKSIDDIIRIEDIPQSIYDEWFNLTNFGKNTGYLFIDEVEDMEYSWVYSNPINHVKFHSNNLNELKEKIEDEKEILFIFNKDLARQAEKKDLIIYHDSINADLRDLDNYTSGNAQDIFDSLKGYEDIFTEAQIMYLCEIMCKNIKLCKYLDDFIQILELNKDKLDKEIYYETYQKLTDNILSSDYDNVFSELSKYADKFNSRYQLTKLLDSFRSKEFISQYYDDFNYIINVNEDKINLADVEECYQEIIDNHIEELINLPQYNLDIYKIFKDLEKLATNFREDQINKLFNLMITKNYISRFYEEFDVILKCNESKYYNITQIYDKIIENALDKLDDWDLYYLDVSYIFKYLKYLSNKFSKYQLNRLSSLMIENVIKGFIANNFRHIFEDNEDKFALNCDKVYSKIIYNRINILKNLNQGNDFDKYIFDDLCVFSDKFTQEQLTNLTNCIFENINICNFAKDFKNILENNRDKCDEIDLDELYFDIIDSRINILTDYTSNPNSDIFMDLGVFAKRFNDNQILKLANIIKERKLISYLNEDILSLFKGNDEFAEIIIDYKLEELDNLTFGFPAAKEILIYLQPYVSNFTESQVTRLCKISINNSQVYKCFICTEYLKFILENNKEKIDKELYEEALIKNNISI